VAGTYTVTLTVDDGHGGTNVATGQVTVVAPNHPPVAGFSSSVTNLGVDFASSSTDPDGDALAYDWDFGDGSAHGTSANPHHDYAVAGTYTVTLTVDDGHGATNQAIHTVTVSPASSAFVSDSFSRTLASGLGTADLGGAWTLTGTASSYSVSGGVARVSVTAGSSRTAALDAVRRSSTDVSAKFSFDAPSTGGGVYSALIGRRIDATNDYRLKLKYSPDGTVTAQLVRTVAGAETVIQSITVPGLTLAPNVAINMRLQVSGSGTTQLNGRVWKAGNPEPATWQLSASDSTAALQANGSVGFYEYLSGSATQTPVTLIVDDLVAKPVA
jgi:PKD repeat protein